ncbi:hypothetical protein Lnau_0796 [Legionella nautarum]|uniref:Uncharacterized protein n=1 Tax=Legionella nautarum TaxID=45070 RepID=A0A0W0WU46_9GAMM|nr:hypothetical protein Lnau_0796 [Legionella nautarum]
MTEFANCFIGKTKGWLLRAIICACLFSFSSLSYSRHHRYYYSACPPYTNCYIIKAMTYYCFNYNKLACTTLLQTPDCEPRLIFPDEQSCMAIILPYYD